VRKLATVALKPAITAVNAVAETSEQLLQPADAASSPFAVAAPEPSVLVPSSTPASSLLQRRQQQRMQAALQTG
jgi:CBS domain containing-hemolysin-like protein